MPSKKKTKRNQTKYPALDKTYNLKTRTELYDYDYIDGYHDSETGHTTRPLNDSEKKFLNKFTEEYINAEFNPRKRRVMKQKKADHPKNANLKKLNKVILDYLKTMNQSVVNSDIASSTKTNLRRMIAKFKNEIKKKIKKEMKFIKDYYKKEAYDNNNARNRCILTKAKASGRLLGLSDLPEDYHVELGEEDKMIENLDLAKQLKSAEDSSDDS